MSSFNTIIELANRNTTDDACREQEDKLGTAMGRGVVLGDY
jgi:hypothetical protein